MINDESVKNSNLFFFFAPNNNICHASQLDELCLVECAKNVF